MNVGTKTRTITDVSHRQRHPAFSRIDRESLIISADNAHWEPRLEDDRNSLALLTRTRIGPRYHGKMDASGIVQVTMMEAYRCLSEFGGTTNSELSGWLRKILARNFADASRALGRKKRDIYRELSLEERSNETSSKLDQWLAAVQTSPSSRAARNESLLQLASALSALPKAQREAIELHHLQGLTLADTAEQIGRTNASVAGLLRRGLGRLRELMDHSTVYRGS